MRRTSLIAAGVVVLVVVLLGVAQLVLPGIAASSIRDRLSRSGKVLDVQVSAFPAIELLWHQADRVVVRMSELPLDRQRAVARRRPGRRRRLARRVGGRAQHRTADAPRRRASQARQSAHGHGHRDRDRPSILAAAARLRSADRFFGRLDHASGHGDPPRRDRDRRRDCAAAERRADRRPRRGVRRAWRRSPCSPTRRSRWRGSRRLPPPGASRSPRRHRSGSTALRAQAVPERHVDDRVRRIGARCRPRASRATVQPRTLTNVLALACKSRDTFGWHGGDAQRHAAYPARRRGGRGSGIADPARRRPGRRARRARAGLDTLDRSAGWPDAPASRPEAVRAPRRRMGGAGRSPARAACAGRFGALEPMGSRLGARPRPRRPHRARPLIR